MKLETPASTRLARAFTLATVFTSLSSGALFAASDTWLSTTAGGNWSVLSNWTSGTGYADGVNATANFTTTTAGAKVANVDVNVTLGVLNLTGNTTSGNGWTLSSNNGSSLTFSTGTSAVPSITTANNSSTHLISATIAGTQGFTKFGGGKLTVGGTNTFSGVMTVADGNLTINNGAAFGASGAGNGTVIDLTSGKFPQLHVLNNITIQDDISIRIGQSSATAGQSQGGNLLYSDSGSNTLSGALTLIRATSGGTGNINIGGVQAGAGTMTLNGPVTGALTGTQANGLHANPNVISFRPTAANANINVNGVISDGNIGTGGISVQTLSTTVGNVRITGANTYTGATIHNKGNLLINNTTGSGTGLGAVTVAGTAVLGGTGFIAPVGTTTVNGVTTDNGVTISGGGIVAPGDLTAAGAAISAGENLTFNLSGTAGKVTFATGALIALDFTVGTSTVNESLAFTGLNAGFSDVVFNDNTVNFSVSGTTLADGLYTLATFDAANAYSGAWVIGTGLEAYATKSLVFGANSIQLQIGAIPEPSSAAALAGLAAIGFGALRRRRRC